MRQLSQNYKSGEIKIQKVPSPALKSGGVLVRSSYSVISLGTEGMKAREGKLSYLGKAKARPDQVKKVLQSVQQQGLWATYQKVMNKLDSLTPLGYSTSGIVEAVAPDVTEFKVGDRVACAGAGYANHSELNFVPKNLMVKVPDAVRMEDAAFATVGSIAMQGYRQSEIQLDEVACVIGLGLIGQILIQILKSAGMRVIGIDLDPSKNQLAESSGCNLVSQPNDPDLLPMIERFTKGKGIDCTFITAGGTSNGPAELAVKIARDRGRVVVIGKTKLDLDWKEYYEKELEVYFSRSYGPGRYDANYEEGGIDYPIGYIRWTENRNLESFLNLVGRECISIRKLISSVYTFDRASELYDELAAGKSIGIGVLFKYSESESIEEQKLPSLISKKESAKNRSATNLEVLSIGAIGAGNYASSMLFPHLKAHQSVGLDMVVTATSLSGQNAKQKFDFNSHSTELSDLIDNKDINAVLIATRHKTHARFTCEALRNQKAVFVEKPLAINFPELEHIRETIVQSGNTSLQVGFNRRFSEPILEMGRFWKNRKEVAFSATYRIHAGKMDGGSWYLDPSEGTRFIGEGGHFIDTLSYLFDSKPVRVFAQAMSPEKASADDFENISAIITYENGSVANLQYLTQGGIKVPKEYLEVHGNGKSAVLTNFRKIDFYEGAKVKVKKYGSIDKGQKKEIEQFVSAAKGEIEFPFTIDELFDTTITTLAIHQSLIENRPVDLSEFWVEK